MPVYGTGTVATLTPGYPAVVWNDENITMSGNGQNSQAINMKRHANMPNCLSVEILFAATPGTFAVDLQTADTNEEKYYVTKATLNTGLNTTFVGRIEVMNIVAKFARLKMVTLTNAVKVTARIF